MNNPEKALAAARRSEGRRRADPQRHAEKKARMAKRLRERRREEKLACFAAYGGTCVCCGEREPVFLTIDHVHGNGNKERRATKLVGIRFYLKLKAEGYPRDRYRVLCYNCNCGRALNGGICPHEVCS